MIDVYFAMSEEQAKREQTRVCIHPGVPGSHWDVYFNMGKVPEELCVEKEIYGWMHSLCVLKKDLPEVMKILYPTDYERAMTEVICYRNDNIWDYAAIVDRIEGDRIWIIGFE